MDRGHLSHSVSTRLVGRVMCGLRSLREEWNEANKEGKSVWDEGTAYIKHTGIKQLRRLSLWRNLDWLIQGSVVGGEARPEKRKREEAVPPIQEHQ